MFSIAFLHRFSMKLPTMSRIGSRGPSSDPSPASSSSLAGESAPCSTLISNDANMQELQHAFAQFDANGDGKISAEELCHVLRSLGDPTTLEEAMLMVADLDSDGDGFISLQEFVDINTRDLAHFGATAGAASPDEVIAAAFAMFDLDQNGRITAENLHSVLSKLGDGTSTLEDCREMIKGVARKGVGHVDFDDFKRMMGAA